MVHSTFNVVQASLGALGSVAPNYERLIYDSNADSALLFNNTTYTSNLAFLCQDQNWLAGYMFANAVQEAEGSRRLTRLGERSAQSRDFERSRLFYKHAKDEARHVGIFLKALHLIFPKASIDSDLLDDLSRGVPYPDSVNSTRMVVPDGVFSDPPIKSVEEEFCQINIGEMKSLVHLTVLKAIVDFSFSETKAPALFDALIRDEFQHISYTAHQIDTLVSRGVDLSEIFRSTISAFNSAIDNKEHGFLD